MICCFTDFKMENVFHLCIRHKKKRIFDAWSDKTSNLASSILLLHRAHVLSVEPVSSLSGWILLFTTIPTRSRPTVTFLHLNFNPAQTESRVVRLEINNRKTNKEKEVMKKGRMKEKKSQIDCVYLKTSSGASIVASMSEMPWISETVLRVRVKVQEKRNSTSSTMAL